MPEPLEEAAPGMGVRKTLGGATYVRLHYSADPAKDAEWAAIERPKMGHRQWAVQMEMNEDLFEGEPVFPEFDPKFHVSDEPLDREGVWQYLAGWDCGTAGLDLAFVLFALTQPPTQIVAEMEVTSMVGESMETFCPRVYREIMKFDSGVWGRIHNFGDESGRNRQGASGKSSFDVARSHQFVIRPSSNRWAGRHSSVVWALTDWIDEQTPRFVVRKSRCPMLFEALSGAYQWRSQTKEFGESRILMMPLKNMWSHVADAAQYGIQEARKMIQGKTETTFNRLARRP